MKRLVLALTLGVLSALLLVAPASAQYGGNPPPAGPPEGCPVTDPPPADPPPCSPRAQAEVSDSDVRPGDPVTVTTPPVFAPGSRITVNIVRANQGESARQLATGTAATDGRVSNTSDMPDLPPGVYFIYVYGTGPDGEPVVALVPVVVRAGESTAAAVEAGTARALTVQGNAVSAPVPVQVAEVQTDLPVDAEAAIVEAVTAGDAGLLLTPEGQLNVRTAKGVQQAGSLPTTGSDGIATQVAVGAALLLAGTGLVLMRRRGFAK